MRAAFARSPALNAGARAGSVGAAKHHGLIPTASLLARAEELTGRHAAIFTGSTTPRSHALVASARQPTAGRAARLVVRAGKKDKMGKGVQKQIKQLQEQIAAAVSAIETELEGRASAPSPGGVSVEEYEKVVAERDALLRTVGVLTSLLEEKGAAGAAPAPPAPAPAGAPLDVIAAVQAEAEAEVARAQAKAQESTVHARALAAELVKAREAAAAGQSALSTPAAAPAPPPLPAAGTPSTLASSPLESVLGGQGAPVASSAASAVAAAVASVSSPSEPPPPSDDQYAYSSWEDEDEDVYEPAAEEEMGPRPALSTGADDVYWVGRLHQSLFDKGYFCGDEDIEDMIFGGRTEEALRTFQCCEGLEESGFTDKATWEKLLGPAPAAPAAPAPAPAAPAPDPAAAVAEAAPLAAAAEAEQGPRPALSAGVDDIYWVGRLQAALYVNGFFCGEEETEDIIFANGTEDALRTFQACNGDLEETGFTDAATWEALLGPVPGTTAAPKAAMRKPKDGKSRANSAWSGGAEANVDSEGKVTRPVLADGDGGRFVHELQIALEGKGYYCGEEDMEWWHFGYTTEMALKTFQASVGLPETGSTYQDVWVALLGDAAYALPGSLDEEEEDLVGDGGRMWLVGEGRWARTSWEDQ